MMIWVVCKFHSDTVFDPHFHNYPHAADWTNCVAEYVYMHSCNQASITLSSSGSQTLQTSGVSFIKLSIDFILKVYVHTKAVFCIRVNVFRFIKPCVRQNLRKNPFINPSQWKSVHTCISTPTTPSNHYIWSLQHLVLLCIITSSAYHFHAYSHPRDTMFNNVKGTRHQGNMRSWL